MALIILDRDGVINEDSDAFIKSPQEWEPIPGSLRAIARLNQAGYRVVVVTNQSGIARGLLDLHTLNAIHRQMHQALAEVGAQVDAVFFCPHGPNDRCDCRKPRPGLFTQIEQRLRIDLAEVPAIGDSLRDLQAAQAASCRPILVRTGKGARTEARLASIPGLAGVPVYRDLAAAVEGLLKG